MEADRDTKQAQIALTMQQARYEGVKAGAAYATGVIGFAAACVAGVLAYLHH